MSVTLLPAGARTLELPLSQNVSSGVNAVQLMGQPEAAEFGEHGPSTAVRTAHASKGKPRTQTRFNAVLSKLSGFVVFSRFARADLRSQNQLMSFGQLAKMTGDMVCDVVCVKLSFTRQQSSTHLYNCTHSPFPGVHRSCTGWRRVSYQKVLACYTRTRGKSPCIINGLQFIV